MKNGLNQNSSNIKKNVSTNITGTTVQINKKMSQNISFAFSNNLSDANISKKDDNKNEKSNISNKENNENQKENIEKSETAADSNADFYNFFENVPKNVPLIDSDVATHASASAKLLKSVFGEPSLGTESTGDEKQTSQSVGKIMLCLTIIILPKHNN